MNFKLFFVVMATLGFIYSPSVFAGTSYKITSSLMINLYSQEVPSLFLAVSSEPPAVISVQNECAITYVGAQSHLSLGVSPGHTNVYDWQTAKSVDYFSSQCERDYERLKNATQAHPVTLYINH